jgi:hypothetical protein
LHARVSLDRATLIIGRIDPLRYPSKEGSSCQSLDRVIRPPNHPFECPSIQCPSIERYEGCRGVSPIFGLSRDRYSNYRRGTARAISLVRVILAESLERATWAVGWCLSHLRLRSSAATKSIGENGPERYPPFEGLCSSRPRAKTRLPKIPRMRDIAACKHGRY